MDYNSQTPTGETSYENSFIEIIKSCQMNSEFAQVLKAVLDAAPFCAFVFDENLNCLNCNQYAVELFGADCRAKIVESFQLLSPKHQPNGELSDSLMKICLEKALSTGYVKFNWLHCDLNGDEIPSEVKIYKLYIDGVDEVILAGFVRDLRSELAGSEENSWEQHVSFSEISQKRLFNMVTDMSDEWFFVLDTRTSMVQYFGKGSKAFGLSTEKELFPDKLIERKIVYNEDLSRFIDFTENIKKGNFRPVDLRLLSEDGIPHYFRMTCNAVFDNNNKPVFVVGKAFDINEQKHLEIRSQTDLLTGCYNKITSETLISDAITNNKHSSHVLFIIDIDNFKAINDNLGHHFGDIVLSEVANNLRSCFRNADVIGRIGGDEFIVFLKDVFSEDIIIDRANKIASAFKNTYSGEHNDYKISGSIGIACYPKDGKNYEELYKASDKALYQSKLRGKDCYTFYTEELLDGTMKNRTTLENADRIANSYFDSELVSTVFNLMYESRESNTSLGAVMQFLGKRTNSDRCYIFETFDKGKTYHNTYEWCKEGINPEIQNLQNLTKEVLHDFFVRSDEKGLFYSNDLRELVADGAFDLMNDQGIKSFLHAQIKEDDYVKLFIGLDDCTKTRVWNEKEINSVLYAAKMLSIFIKPTVRVIPELTRQNMDDWEDK